MGDNTDDGRWMSYDALAKLRDISRIGAVRLVQRKKWRRQAGNDGKALVLVPHDQLAPVRGSPAGKGAGNKGDDIPFSAAGNASGNDAGDVTRTIGALEAAFQIALQAKDKVIEEQAARIGELKGAVMRAELAASVAQERLQQMEAAEMARKARGRWARLRAAWRGD